MPKGGVHIQSRGNVALPTDTVKLLKTQDENYVRTMRSSGLKVRLHFISIGFCCHSHDPKFCRK